MRRVLVTVAAALLLAGCNLQLSADSFTNASSQHRTQVEPDTFSFGSTIVSTFQSGRFFNGGASGIGWATSTDGGSHWAHGFLPGITKYQGAGPYDRASDPSVAYDRRHNFWLISSLALIETSGDPQGRAVVVSRSSDGGLTWGNPATVASGTFFDKNWTVCDNAPGSASYGHCYTEYDDATAGDRIHMATSTNGGLTWTQATVPAANGLGGQPLVQPNGTVIVPYLTTAGTLAALRSTNGGTSYTGPFGIASLTPHTVAGNLRASSLPSAEIDAAGKVYIVWADCRFRTGCPGAPNDIVMKTSLDGITWSTVMRVPIDPTNSTVDHFIPGLGVDRTTSGSSAHLALTYYYYPNASCTSATCQLDVGFVSSTNGGASWSATQQLGGPMSLSWLANTNQGPMVGDYISTSFSSGTAFPAFALANAPSNGVLDEATYTVAGGLGVSGGGATSHADHAFTPHLERSATPIVSRY
jgi:hypothetical protein